MKKLFISAFSCLCLSTAVAQPQLIEKIAPTADKGIIPYERWKLSNGLTVLLHEDHTNPLVNVMVTYKVGSNRESLGKSGFAHFFEHMMFQGSKHVADEELFKIISSAGGSNNGFTQWDKTVYFETVPSNYMETALFLESDRMGFLLDSLTTKKFENQRDAVKNEKSQNFENQPYALAFEEEIKKALYPDGHPYSWPVIGYVDDLNRANVDDVKNFFMRWYGPNNAILAVSGDFNPQETLTMIDKYFGTLKQCPEVKKLRVPPVVIATDKYTAYRDRIYLPLNLRVYPTVPQYHRDEAALDILARMMGSGNNSIFYKNFVKSKLALDASVSHQTLELGGEFSIQIFAIPPDDFNLEKLFSDLDAKVKSTIDDFEKTGITDEAIQRAKSQFETELYGYLSSAFTVNLVMSEWERLQGKSSSLTEEIGRYTKVTKDDITRVFNKYIKGAGAAILNTYPIMNDKDSVKSTNPHSLDKFPPNPEYAGLSYSPNPDKFDRSVRPVPTAPKPIVLPNYYSFKTKNGITVIGTKNTQSPEITLLLKMEGGSLVLSPEQYKKIGIAELTADMMNEGTKNYSTEQIQAELEKIGAKIEFSASKNSTTITISCLKKNLDGTLKLLEEKLLNPGFKDEDFKLAKKKRKESIKDEQTRAEEIAQNNFMYALYGNSVLGIVPTTKSVENIELDDLRKYYDSNYSPSVANLVIVGDLEESEITPKLSFLEKWQAKEVKILAIPEPVQPTEQQFYLVNKPAAPSTVICMGNTSLKYDAYGDYYKNRIANFMLGGNFNSRLNLNLREEKGYTYGIYSYFQGNKYYGAFTISSSVKRQATAVSIAEISKEFTKYVDKGIDDKELEFVKNSLLNQEAIKYESPFQKANFLSNIAEYNLDKDYTVKQNQILKNMTLTEVNSQVKKAFDSSRLTTVIVGDKGLIEAQLERAAKDPKNKDILSKIKLKKLQ